MRKMMDTDPDHYKVDVDNFTRFMEDPQIKGFGDWMYANGFNSGLCAGRPTIGSWIRHGEEPIYVIECSLCGQRYFNHARQPFAKYCSECGSKMKGCQTDNQIEATKQKSEPIQNAQIAR